nr:response regulator [Liquorilactobacillus satsumensis]
MSKIRILAVEDDHEVGRLITMTLKANHYVYEWSKTGNDALSVFSLFQPEVILLDLGLPDMDGIEVIKQVRAINQTPIIVISAHSEEEDKISALDEGGQTII